VDHGRRGDEHVGLRHTPSRGLTGGTELARRARDRGRDGQG
jgi:hypothetical protein